MAMIVNIRRVSARIYRDSLINSPTARQRPERVDGMNQSIRAAPFIAERAKALLKLSQSDEQSRRQPGYCVKAPWSCQAFPLKKQRESYFVWRFHNADSAYQLPSNP